MSLYKTMGDDVPDLYREIAASGEKPFIWMIFEIVQAKLQYRKASQTDLLLTMAENKW